MIRLFSCLRITRANSGYLWVPTASMVFIHPFKFKTPCAWSPATHSPTGGLETCEHLCPPEDARGDKENETEGHLVLGKETLKEQFFRNQDQTTTRGIRTMTRTRTIARVSSRVYRQPFQVKIGDLGLSRGIAVDGETGEDCFRCGLHVLAYLYQQCQTTWNKPTETHTHNCCNQGTQLWIKLSS